MNPLAPTLQTGKRAGRDVTKDPTAYIMPDTLPPSFLRKGPSKMEF